MAKRHGRKPKRRLAAKDLLAAAPVLLTSAIAFVVVAQVSIAGEFRATRPTVALTVMPADADAKARLAGQLATNSPLPEARDAARDLAQGAIMRSALSPVAIRALGQLRANDGNSPADQNEAARLFGEVTRLSRRDHQTQIWLVEYYLKRNSLPEAVHHLDIALRTWSSGEATLFPVLSTAAADPRIADILVTRMKGRPGWALPFANYLVAQAPSNVSSYVLARTLDPRIEDEKALIGKAMWRYASTGDYQPALEFHERFDLGARKSSGADRINDGGFEGSNALPPFAWSYVQEADLWAAPEEMSARNHALLLSAAGGKSGELARQLLQLRPGTYRVKARFGEVPRETYQRPTLTIRCADGDKATLVSAKPESDEAGESSIDSAFSVGGSCEFQWIAISMTGPEIERSERPWVDDVSIVQSGGQR